MIVNKLVQKVEQLNKVREINSTEVGILLLTYTEQKKKVTIVECDNSWRQKTSKSYGIPSKVEVISNTLFDNKDSFLMCLINDKEDKLYIQSLIYGNIIVIFS